MTVGTETPSGAARSVLFNTCPWRLALSLSTKLNGSSWKYEKFKLLP